MPLSVPEIDIETSRSKDLSKAVGQRRDQSRKLDPSYAQTCYVSRSVWLRVWVFDKNLAGWPRIQYADDSDREFNRGMVPFSRWMFILFSSR